jgi:hypothetical protein
MFEGILESTLFNLVYKLIVFKVGGIISSLPYSFIINYIFPCKEVVIRWYLEIIHCVISI